MSEYYNTTHATGREVLRYRRQAQSQAARILEFFEENPNQAFTPSEVCQFVFENVPPLNSIRGRMSSLTEAGKLVKTTRQKTGIYGRPEYYWRLASGQLELLP